MTSRHRLAETAALMADASRAGMLTLLMDGAARPAGELAAAAGVTAATASGHLAQLVAAGLLSVEPRGRQRWFRLAGPVVAGAIEALARLSTPARATRELPERVALREARLCYDHLAGVAGVAIAEALVAKRWLATAPDGFRPRRAGERGFARLGVRLDELAMLRRPLVRACLDWTERREHLAGALGAALASHALERGWFARIRGTRALRLTEAGSIALRRILGVRLEPRVAGSERPAQPFTM